MNTTRTVRAYLFALTIACSSAGAAITSVSGAGQKISAPADVTTGKLESDTIIYAFEERSGVATSQSISLDITQPGTVPGTNGNNLTPGSVAQGTAVNSYYVHYDKVGGNDTVKSATGSFTFGEEILGIIVSLSGLTATNSTLGAPGTSYSTGSSQHIELTDGTMITLSSDRRTVSVTLRVTCCSDNLRVITRGSGGGTVPVPLVTGGGGLGGLGTGNLCGSCGTGLATMAPFTAGILTIAKRRRVLKGKR